METQIPVFASRVPSWIWQGRVMLLLFQGFSAALRDAASSWRLQGVSRKELSASRVLSLVLTGFPAQGNLGLWMLVLQEVWLSASGIG